MYVCTREIHIINLKGLPIVKVFNTRRKRGTFFYPADLRQRPTEKYLQIVIRKNFGLDRKVLKKNDFFSM